jgi:flavin reductase (DIM6/NTAB) family NADH-FMN oxidoreductase RutF
MRQWTTGISLVTSQDDGRPHGMTVTSFTSVSLTPPMILVSIERTTRTHRMLLARRTFAVSLLAADQRDLADRFAGRVADSDDRFAGIAFHTVASGSPIPEGSLAYLDCRLAAAHGAGTHTLFLGEVIDGGLLRQAPPLIYFDRDYRRLAEGGG